MQVSLRRQEIADRLNAWTIFNDKNKEFCDWLTQMENKVCHRGDLSIEEMVEKLKKVRQSPQITDSQIFPPGIYTRAARQQTECSLCCYAAQGLLCIFASSPKHAHLAKDSNWSKHLRTIVLGRLLDGRNTGSGHAPLIANLLLCFWPCRCARTAWRR